MAEETRFAARDGLPLAASVFEGRRDPPVAVVVNGATAVPRSYYAAFASWLAERGTPVLTYDYRGIGGSRPPRLRGAPFTMAQWATEDMAGAVAFSRARWPSARLAVVGHSSGGWLLGFCPQAAEFSAATLVASQSGWWGHWPWPSRARRWVDWHLLLPVVSRAWGYVPGRLGLGEDLPGGVAREWARWCRRRDFTGGDPRADYARLRFPVTAYSFPDDSYAPPASVDALLAQFRSAPVERRIVTAAEAGAPVGHFGFFRPRFSALWPAVAEDLAAAAKRP